MGQDEPTAGSKAFGTYLRRVRESRKLSLDAVEEMSVEFPERVTKSHLSRIENGLALPTFPRLWALSRVYGVPLGTLADRFEIESRRESSRATLAGQSPEQIREDAARLREQGRYGEALELYLALLESTEIGAPETAADPERTRHWRLNVVNCLVHLGRFELAKAEAEAVLSEDSLSPEHRFAAIHFFAFSCWKLGRHTVALMGLDLAEKEARDGVAPRRTAADLLALRGHVLSEQTRHAEAEECLKSAMTVYKSLGDDYEACRALQILGEVQLAAKKAAAARETLEAAAKWAEAKGYERHLGLALGNLAALHFEEGDLPSAERLAIRSNSIARVRDFLVLVFRNCFTLWKIALARGDAASARANERSLRALLGRLEENLPEADAFRDHVRRNP